MGGHSPAPHYTSPAEKPEDAEHVFSSRVAPGTPDNIGAREVRTSAEHRCRAAHVPLDQVPMRPSGVQRIFLLLRVIPPPPPCVFSSTHPHLRQLGSPSSAPPSRSSLFFRPRIATFFRLTAGRGFPLPPPAGPGVAGARRRTRNRPSAWICTCLTPGPRGVAPRPHSPFPARERPTLAGGVPWPVVSWPAPPRTCPWSGPPPAFCCTFPNTRPAADGWFPSPIPVFHDLERPTLTGCRPLSVPIYSYFRRMASVHPRPFHQ